MTVVMRVNPSPPVAVVNVLLAVFVGSAAEPPAACFAVDLAHCLLSTIRAVLLQSTLIYKLFTTACTFAFSDAQHNGLTGAFAPFVSPCIFFLLFLAAFRAEPGAGPAEELLAADRADPRGKRCTW